MWCLVFIIPCVLTGSQKHTLSINHFHYIWKSYFQSNWFNFLINLDSFSGWKSVDPDQLVSQETSWSGSTIFHQLDESRFINVNASLDLFPWVKVFRIYPEFRILRLIFHRKSASKCWIRKLIIDFLKKDSRIWCHFMLYIFFRLA